MQNRQGEGWGGVARTFPIEAFYFVALKRRFLTLMRITHLCSAACECTAQVEGSVSREFGCKLIARCLSGGEK